MVGLYDELEGLDWRKASEVGSKHPLCSTALSQQQMVSGLPDKS